MSTSFTLNGQPVSVDADPDMPILWVIREQMKLTGTKFGCGIAQCGACTIHMDGYPTRACQLPLSAVEGSEITTIEGAPQSDKARAFEAAQQAWREIDVVQCGYCQSGQLMSAAALLAENPDPTDDDIDGAMGGNLCRCATYVRIRKAIHLAAQNLKGDAK